jgi:hypothetical protein
MNRPSLISYYTGDSYYKDCSNILREYCTSIGAEIFIESVEDKGSYWKNTLYKPIYILNKLKEMNSDIIWIDVDTRISKYPECFKKWDSDLLLASHTGTLEGIKASPLGIKYNKRTISFFESWAYACEVRMNSGDVDLDHDVMKYEILPEMIGKISIGLMKDDMEYNDFTNGCVIDNGTSRVPNKGRDMSAVINKNKSRQSKFNLLNLNNFL